MSEIIFLGSTFCALITAYILFFKLPEYQQHSGRLLAFLMLFFGWSAMNYLLISSGWLIDVPFLLKSGAPINFLIPPFIYLYIRSVLKDQKKLSYVDFIHFLPFFLVIINYFPIYNLSSANKELMIRGIINNFSNVYLKAQGYLSDLTITILRIVQTLIYLVIQFKMLWSYNKESLLLDYKKHTQNIFNWLYTLNWLYLAGFIGNFALFIIVCLDPPLANSSQTLMIPAYILSISFLGISSYLLVNPEVLFGLPYATAIIEEGNDKKRNETEPAKRDYSKEITLLKKYFEEQLPYLDNTLNINKVAVETGIHSREISFIINQHFNQRFTDFVNTHRVNYINNKIQSGYLNEYTIESLYKEAGFSSKSTFHTAFKKINNCTPSEFILRKTSPSSLTSNIG